MPDSLSRPDRARPFRLSGPSPRALMACLGMLAAALPARGFEAGPKTTVHWIFDSAHVEGGGFRNLASAPGGPPLLPWMGGAPVIKEFDGRRGVQVSGSAFGELPYRQDLTAGNPEKIISYGARIKLDTLRKDFGSFLAGFYDALRFMVDTVGRLHLGMQNEGVRRRRQWLRTDSEEGQPRVQAKKWHEVVYTVDARDPGRVLGYLFLDGKQLRNPHFAVNDDGVRANSQHGFRVGKLPGPDEPPWFGGPLNGLISELIVEKGYLIEPAFPHTGPLNNRVNLGTRSVSARPGETLRVPVLLTNYSDLALSSCQLILRLDADVAQLTGVETAGAAKDWTLTWNPQGTGAYAISLAGFAAPMRYGESQVLTLTLKVAAAARDGDFSDMSLDEVKLDENRQLEVSTATGRIRVEEAAVYGDVNGDGKADPLDAGKVLEYVVGSLRLPDPSVPGFTPAVADVSGNGEITSYDAALILQHAAGLLPDFPVQRRPKLAKTAAQRRTAPFAAARLALSGPVPLGGGRYEYRLSGEGLEGLASGEFALEPAPGKACKLESVASSLRSAALTASQDPGSNRFAFTLATNDRFQAFPPEFVSIEVSQCEEGAAMTLASAYLNEGVLTGNFLSAPVRSPSGTRAPPGPGKASRPDIRVSRGMLVVPSSGPLTITLYDLSGRPRSSRHFSGAGIHRMPLETLAPGLFAYEVRTGGRRYPGWAIRM